MATPLSLVRQPLILIPSNPLLPLLSRPFQSRLQWLSSSPLSSLAMPLRSVATDAAPVVVVDDEKYGKKQVISLTSQLYEYVLSNVREPPILRELRGETSTMRGSQMQGYSSLAVALALPESGHLVACERDAKCLEIAKKYYERAGVSHKVDVKLGLAADSLRALLFNGEACSYDFAFVDAEKRLYEEYFELLLQLVRDGGLIVFDNVLWHGKTADPQVNDPKTVSIRNFNKKILEDERISISMDRHYARRILGFRRSRLVKGK
ncbi:uncharacterized protein [Typha angustifolia]|uniref:uncharacterized protein isoform X4 n=1 Tax=Typha angustifolia TaxID=59011 RepID=UPI003C2CD28B